MFVPRGSETPLILSSTLLMPLGHALPWYNVAVLQLHSLSAVTSLWWPHLADTFDAVIYSRFDVLYVKPVPVALVAGVSAHRNTVYVPKWGWWQGGVNDQFSFAHPSGLLRTASA
jgi:hypothetical protein